MTIIVVTADCKADQEVLVTLKDNRNRGFQAETILQNGEQKNFHIHSDLVLSTKVRFKEPEL